MFGLIAAGAIGFCCNRLKSQEYEIISSISLSMEFLEYRSALTFSIGLAVPLVMDLLHDVVITPSFCLVEDRVQSIIYRSYLLCGSIVLNSICLHSAIQGGDFLISWFCVHFQLLFTFSSSLNYAHNAYNSIWTFRKTLFVFCLFNCTMLPQFLNHTLFEFSSKNVVIFTILLLSLSITFIVLLLINIRKQYKSDTSLEKSHIKWNALCNITIFTGFMISLIMYFLYIHFPNSLDQIITLITYLINIFNFVVVWSLSKGEKQQEEKKQVNHNFSILYLQQTIIIIFFLIIVIVSLDQCRDTATKIFDSIFIP